MVASGSPRDKQAVEISHRESVAAGSPRHKLNALNMGWRRKAAATAYFNILLIVPPDHDARGNLHGGLGAAPQGPFGGAVGDE